MNVFGLTGGIASGKSTVGKVFAKLGVPVVDADQLARDITAKGEPALTELVEAFGSSILTVDGDLDRKALARLAFADAQSRAKLNAITHPRIATLTQKRLDDLRATGEPLVCYEAALLVENGLADAFRPLVVVSSDEPTQISRAIARDAAGADEIRARIRAQKPLADKLAAADFIIENDGDLATLERRANETLELVRRRTQSRERT